MTGLDGSTKAPRDASRAGRAIGAMFFSFFGGGGWIGLWAYHVFARPHRENGNVHAHNVYVVHTFVGTSRHDAQPGMAELIDVQSQAGAWTDSIRDEPFDGQAGIGALRFVRERVAGRPSIALVPRRRPGLRTFADYRFTQTEAFDDDGAYAWQPDRSWAIGMLVLEDGDDRKLLCVTDASRGEGTHHTATVVEVVPDRDGRWRATGRVVARPDCAATRPTDHRVRAAGTAASGT